MERRGDGYLCLRRTTDDDVEMCVVVANVMATTEV